MRIQNGSNLIVTSRKRILLVEMSALSFVLGRQLLRWCMNRQFFFTELPDALLLFLLILGKFHSVRSRLFLEIKNSHGATDGGTHAEGFLKG